MRHQLIKSLCSSPLVTACTLSGEHKISPNRRIDTLRLLANDLDFTEAGEVDSQSWNMVLVLLESERPSSGFSDETIVSEWLLEFLGPFLKNNLPKHQAAWILTFVLEVRSLTEKVLDIQNDLVHVTFGIGGFSPLQSKIAEGFPPSCMPSMRLLAERGANLHYLGCSEAFGARFAHGATAQFDTATSLSMRQSLFFYRWRQLLRELDVDLKNFIREELEQHPLRQQGWTQDSLTALFNFEFSPVELPNQYCNDCGREVYCVYKLEEDWWNVILQRLKGGRDPYTGNRPREEFHTTADTYPHLADRFAKETDGEDGNTSAGSLDSSILSFVSCVEEWDGEEAGKLLCWKCGILQRSGDTTKPN